MKSSVYNTIYIITLKVEDLQDDPCGKDSLPQRAKFGLWPRWKLPPTSLKLKPSTKRRSPPNIGWNQTTTNRLDGLSGSFCWWLKSGYSNHLGWCWNPINNGIFTTNLNWCGFWAINSFTPIPLYNNKICDIWLLTANLGPKRSPPKKNVWPFPGGDGTHTEPPMKWPYHFQWLAIAIEDQYQVLSLENHLAPPEDEQLDLRNFCSWKQLIFYIPKQCETGVIILPTQTMHYNKGNTWMFDSPQMGNVMMPVKSTGFLEKYSL